MLCYIYYLVDTKYKIQNTKMKFSLLDQNVSTTMNVFIIIANIINLVYNLPQIYKTYKTKSTKDFSEWFLLLRVVGNVIWIPYSIEINSMLLLINTLVTVIASIFIGYYKVVEIINKKRFELYIKITNNEVEYINENINNITNDTINKQIDDKMISV